MIPFPIVDTLHDTLRGDRRTPDGLLHCSGDLIGSLRHAQLRAAGAPTVESELISDVRLRTGTMWHEYVARSFMKRGMPFMAEVNLTPFMPEGWAGTADWIFFDPKARTFELGDLKTIKGEGIRWVERDGIKESHLWQLSAYWYALKHMGLPRLRKSVSVLYLPMNTVPKEDIEPLVLEAKPLPEDVVLGRMEERWTATKTYLDELQVIGRTPIPPEDVRWWLNEYLAPPIERELKVYWNSKQKVFDVKLSPHWITKFCPYPNELCDCSEQGYTKVGHFELGECEHPGELYVPRKGYEEYDDYDKLPMPDPKDYIRRLKEAA